MALVKAHQLNTGNVVEEVGKGGDWVGESCGGQFAGGFIQPAIVGD